MTFWTALDRLVAECPLVIDRPKGTAHPRRPEQIYPFDYGYLEGTQAADRGGIDVFVGSADSRSPGAVILTVDPHKRDAEIKVLLGCNAEETEAIVRFLEAFPLACVLVRR